MEALDHFLWDIVSFQFSSVFPHSSPTAKCSLHQHISQRISWQFAVLNVLRKAELQIAWICLNNALSFIIWYHWIICQAFSRPCLHRSWYKTTTHVHGCLFLEAAVLNLATSMEVPRLTANKQNRNRQSHYWYWDLLGAICCQQEVSEIVWLCSCFSPPAMRGSLCEGL